MAAACCENRIADNSIRRITRCQLPENLQRRIDRGSALDQCGLTEGFVRVVEWALRMTTLWDCGERPMSRTERLCLQLLRSTGGVPTGRPVGAPRGGRKAA